MNSPRLEEAAEPILQLIRNARELDRSGKMKAARHELIAARMKLAEAVRDNLTEAQAEREVDNARRRVRNAANSAEDKLRRLISSATLWQWTDPDRAIREMRGRYFGGSEHLPLTDIEEALKNSGNVLWIMAVYGALQGPIWKRMGEMRRSAHDEAAQDHPSTS
jgi:hypothetical protein